MNAPSDQVAAGQGDMPPTSPPGRWLRAAAFYAEMVGLVVVVVLFLTGVIGQVGFWRGITAVTLFNFAVLIRLNNQLFADIERQHAELAYVIRIVNAVQSVPYVRCAGCHVRAALVRGEAVEPDDETMPMPPGWEMRDERPYCPTCLAK